MQKLRTLNLPPHQGRDVFLTVFVEPDPEPLDSFSVPADADEWGISIHFQPDAPYESHVEVARINTTHGEPHFDRLYLPDQPKEWLGHEYTMRTPEPTCCRTGETTPTSSFGTTAGTALVRREMLRLSVSGLVPGRWCGRRFRATACG